MHGEVSQLVSDYITRLKFFRGLLQEKLFLTTANVQSAMERLDFLPDPWVSPYHYVLAIHG